MPRYMVLRREVWVQPVMIDAETPEEARRMVANGGGTELDNHLEYSHVMPVENWSVEENGKLVLD